MPLQDFLLYLLPMPKIHFLREGKTIELKPLSLLWKAKEHGIVFVKEPNCGGQGKCKRCKCKIDGKVIDASCLYRVEDQDIAVETLIGYETEEKAL